MIERFFNALSLRAKLVTMMFGVALAATSLGFGLLMAHTLYGFADDENGRVALAAQILADYSIAPLRFDQPEGLQERLHGLQMIPEVLALRVVDREGKEFFSWWGPHSGPAPRDWAAFPEGVHLGIPRFRILAPIRYRGETLGRVELLASSVRLQRRIGNYLGVLSGVSLVVLALAFVLANRWQRVLSGPILHLAEVTRRVSSAHDYKVRVHREAQDELADLYEGFNQLMAHLMAREQERDQAYAQLRDSHLMLEHRVEERTRELWALVQALEQENQERREAEARLQSSLEEKEVLLREVHHRVKNNLQVIYSLLSLQLGQVADPEVREVLEDSRQRVRAMAIVHETLYRSEELGGVEVEDFVRCLTGDLGAIHGRPEIRCELDLAPVRLDLDRAVPLGLILNELLTNAYKYAFPDGQAGCVRVRLRSLPGALELEVADDGAGLPDGEVPRGLGIRLVKALAGQLGGEAEWISEGGLRCRIRFPFQADS